MEKGNEQNDMWEIFEIIDMQIREMMCVVIIWTYAGLIARLLLLLRCFFFLFFFSNTGEVLVCANLKQLKTYLLKYPASSNRSQEIDVLYISEYFMTICVSANLPFGYVPTGPDRTSF